MEERGREGGGMERERREGGVEERGREGGGMERERREEREAETDGAYFSAEMRVAVSRRDAEWCGRHSNCSSPSWSAQSETDTVFLQTMTSLEKETDDEYNMVTMTTNTQPN